MTLGLELPNDSTTGNLEGEGGQNEANGHAGASDDNVQNAIQTDSMASADN